MKTLYILYISALWGIVVNAQQSYIEQIKDNPYLKKNIKLPVKYVEQSNFKSYSDSTLVSWVNRYDGPGNGDDVSEDMVMDAQGNIYITGTSMGSGSNFDFATIKYSLSGTEDWTVRYNGQGNGSDQANAIAVDDSGNVYVTGWSLGTGNNYDYTTIKYNSFGSQIWVAQYNGPGDGDDVSNDIIVDDSGNVYVTGQSWGGSTFYDFATIKYSSSGTQEWISRYNGPGNGSDYGLALDIDNLGNVYVTGYGRGSGTIDDYETIKYNASGDEVWVARYNGPGNDYDYASSIVIDNEGYIYVAGASRGSGTEYDFATIKYDTTGTQKWIARYNGPGNGPDYPYAIAIDDSGNVYETGTSNLDGGFVYDYATIKYSRTGTQEWVARYNGTGANDDVATALAIDAAGNTYVTGYSVGDTSWYDYTTIKYDANGSEQWVARYNGPKNDEDEASAIAVDNSGSVYVTGESYGISSGKDYTTIKYVQESTPVELTSFIASADGNNVLLNWSTATETNNRGFEIERTKKSKLNNQKWENIGFVSGNGTTSKPETYSFVDKNIASGTYNYRLNQFDFDGKFKYSKVIEVNVKVPSQFLLSQNYPNPFNPATQIDFRIPEEGYVTLKVYNSLGEQVANLVDGYLKAGQHIVSFDGSRLSSGVYYYRIESGSNTQVRKMILMK